MTSPEPLAGLTGRGVRIAIVDSGVNPDHPHVGGVAGGVALCAGGADHYLDHLGHGTAVASAIRERAPEASLFAVKVFDRALATRIDRLVRALEWSIAERMDIINLSLGTGHPAHRGRLEALVEQAVNAGIAVVAARGNSAAESLPGALPGVIGVGLDWDCPRESYRCLPSGPRLLFVASGYPRAIPGVPPSHNLMGISFAVANMSGFVARARQAAESRSLASLEKILAANAAA